MIFINWSGDIDTIGVAIRGKYYSRAAANSAAEFTNNPVTGTAIWSSLNPSHAGGTFYDVYYPGQEVTFTASGYGGSDTAPTGTVQFKDGETNLGGPLTLDSNGMASYSTTDLTEGEHSITAVYSGDGSFAPGISNELIQTVLPPLPDLIVSEMDCFTYQSDSYDYDQYGSVLLSGTSGTSRPFGGPMSAFTLTASGTRPEQLTRG
jgi:hypothetical protein